MFTKEETNQISKKYFKIIDTSAFCVTLQSKNTHHYWHILNQEYKTFSSCLIYHKHNKADAYHLHGHAKTLNAAIQNIKDHDIFQLSGRKKHRKL